MKRWALHGGSTLGSIYSRCERWRVNLQIEVCGVSWSSRRGQGGTKACSTSLSEDDIVSVLTKGGQPKRHISSRSKAQMTRTLGRLRRM